MNKKDNKLHSFQPSEWYLLALTPVLHAPCVRSVDYTPLSLRSTQPPGAPECFRRAVSHAASWTNIELYCNLLSLPPPLLLPRVTTHKHLLDSPAASSEFSSLQGCFRPNFGSSRLPENFGNTESLRTFFLFFPGNSFVAVYVFKFQLQRLSALSD